jgi:uncharacterized protein involved in outer membrane biogenesis
MKRSRKLFNWIAGVIIALIIIVVIVVSTFDWNRLKPYLNDKVSQAIGRPFAINGDLSVARRRGISNCHRAASHRRGRWIWVPSVSTAAR